MAAGGAGETPEIRRYVEILDRVSANHLEAMKAIEGLKGHIGILGQNIDHHADEDRRKFNAHSKAMEAHGATLAAHILACSATEGPPTPKRPKTKATGIAGLGAGAVVFGNWVWERITGG